MIEVEKKFLLSEADIMRLTRDATFLSERSFTDIYYDTGEYSLTRQDRWLRAREGTWELKLPLHDGEGRLVDQYHELDDEQEIRSALQLSETSTLADALITQGYAPFCVCRTTRKKYQREQFIIDLDVVDFADFSYHIGEIELLVNEIDDSHHGYPRPRHQRAAHYRARPGQGHRVSTAVISRALPGAHLRRRTRARYAFDVALYARTNTRIAPRLRGPVST